MAIEYSPLVVILAAGSSQRFNAIKQIATVRFKQKSESMLSLAINKIHSVNLPIVVATGEYHKTLLTQNEHQLDFHYCDQAKLGMGHTIAQITEYVTQEKPNTSHICFLLADQVAITTNEILSLISAGQNNPNNIICCKTNQGLCAPSVFPSRYFAQLKNLSGDKGAKAIIQQNLEHVFAVNVLNANIDIDNHSDLIQWNLSQDNNKKVKQHINSKPISAKST